MLDTDPLSFLDEEPSKARNPVRNAENRHRSDSSGTDPLSFLDEHSESEQNPSLAESSASKSTDPLSFLEEPEEPQGHWYDKLYDKLTPKPFKKDQKLLDIYRVEEKTAEELRDMPFEEKMRYMEDMKRMREMQQSQGFTKGALSGFSFGASELIPGLKPNEEDLMVGLGDAVGSYLPIVGLYKYIGAPIVKFASKSPVARSGLEALARMTGFGLTGAVHKGAKELVKGEVPTVEELAKEGAVWAGIDAVLQTMGLGVAFAESVNRIAEAEGVTAKEVLGKLWNSTKNFVKTKFGRSVKGEVLPEDIEVLLQEAKKAESAIPKETEIEVRPAEESVAQPKETEPTATPSEHIETDLSQAKAELAEVEKSQGQGATNGKSALIQKINELELEKHNRAKQEGPEKEAGQEAAPTAIEPQESESAYTREDFPTKAEAQEYLDHLETSLAKAPEAHKAVIRRDIKNLENLITGFEKEVSQETFTTSKGSTYQINEDGSTTRTKAARPEHAGEEGIQPKSEKTWYVTPEESVKLGEFQASGEGKKIVELPNGQLGVQYLTGKDAGKIEKRTLVDFSSKPAEGLIPVEAWNEGEKIHFGNQIVKIEKPKKVERNAEPVLQSKVAEEAGSEAVEEVPQKATQVPPRGTKPLHQLREKQAVARSKIVDLFRKAFHDPIRLGKISQRNAAGIHKLWPKVTRLLKANDIETVAHEIGHNLHTTLYGGNAKTAQEQFKNIDSELRPYLDELKPLAHYEPWGWRALQSSLAFM